MSSGASDLLVNILLLFSLLIGLLGWRLTMHGSVRGRIALRTRDAGAYHRAKAVELQDEFDERSTSGKVWQQLAVMGDKVPLFDAAYRAKLHMEMIRGGFRNKHAVSVLLAIKFGVGLLCATMGVMFGSHVPMLGGSVFGRGAIMLCAFVVGMILPEYVLKYRAKKRRSLMESCFPDALDLSVICTNAGNSFAVSIRRVADELTDICPPLSQEFSLTADELSLSGDTTRSLVSLGERINLPQVRALISTLTQSMRYGTPITQALRTLSRTERLTHIVSLEEKAAKLAPKMVVPMLMFILPPVVCIAAGPAVIQLMAVIHKGSGG